MEVQFLMLPFTGIRDKQGNLYAIGHKYSAPSYLKTCSACIYSRTNIFKNSYGQLYSQSCSKHILQHIDKIYKLNHECKYFYEKYKLKKL